MRAQRTPIPSPLAGEGGERSEPGEGVSSHESNEATPSPGRSLCSRPPSPARGEGREQAARVIASHAPALGTHLSVAPQAVAAQEPAR